LQYAMDSDRQRMGITLVSCLWVFWTVMDMYIGE
jgi:hypothetical protein